MFNIISIEVIMHPESTTVLLIYKVFLLMTKIIDD